MLPGARPRVGGMGAQANLRTHLVWDMIAPKPVVRRPGQGDRGQGLRNKVNATVL